MGKKTYILLPLLLTGAFFIATTAWANGKTEERVGKTASITLDHETQVGNVTLQPGEYTVRDRVVGSDHFMVFQRTRANNYYSSISYDVGKPRRVECRMEPLAGKVSDTTVAFDPEGSVYKLTRIDIAGETVEHLF